MEQERPKLSLIDRLRGRTVGQMELEAAVAAGQAEPQCQANWMTGGATYDPERCPRPADCLIEADTPSGQLKMSVCDSHESLLHYLDGRYGKDELEGFTLDNILNCFPSDKQPLVQSSIEETIGRPYSEWLAETVKKRQEYAELHADGDDGSTRRYRKDKARRDEHRRRQSGLDV